MSGSSLCLHTGARRVSWDQLRKVETPEPTETWFPVPHARVLEMACGMIEKNGFAIKETRIALSRGDARLFAVIDTTTGIGGDGGLTTLSVGINNSLDRSLRMKFIAGNRVFVCDNLALCSDLMAPVAKKHTKFGESRFEEEMVQAVQGLDHFVRLESDRVRRFRETEIDDRTAESVLLRAYKSQILSARNLENAYDNWVTPEYPEFIPRTLWSLENVFTGIFKPIQQSNPLKFTRISLGFRDLLNDVLPRSVPVLQDSILDGAGKV